MAQALKTFLALWLAGLWVGPALAAAGASAGSLEGRGECVGFRWEPNPTGSPHGAISVPVTLNGRPFWFQLDTGTDTDIIYGDIADRAGWSRTTDKRFRAAHFQIGTVDVVKAPLAVWRDQPLEETAGEIGLADLVGRTTVIDYVARRFCLFPAGEAPTSLLGRANWIEGALSNGKFFLPVQTGSFQSSRMVFDTGSSELPLWVGLSDWRAITGLQEPSKARSEVKGSHFTTPISFRGSASLEDVLVGPVSVGRRTTYVQVEDPEMFAKWAYPVHGIIGNQIFEDKILILDLAESRTRLGVVAASAQH